jgi:hypothetical protein
VAIEVHSERTRRDQPDRGMCVHMGQDERMTDRVAMEAYLRRCLAFFDEVRGLVPDLDLRDAESLLQHGEPAEGISNLAWALASSDVKVLPLLAETIRELTTELIPEDELPEQFRLRE